MKKSFPWLATLFLVFSSGAGAEDLSNAAEASPPSAGGDVFLTLSRSPLPQEALPTNAVTISAEEIQKTGARNVAEVLEKETSFNVVRAAGRGSLQSVTIRGFASSGGRVLILVDGRPVRDVFTGAVDLSQIPVDNVDRIEIVKGPASALYGANAVGGAIHILTKRARTEAPTGAFTAQAGSYGSDLYRLEFAQKSGAVDASVSGSRGYASAFRDNADFADYAANATVGIDGQALGRTEMQGRFVQSNVGAPGGVNFAPDQFDGQREKAALFPDTRQQDRDRAVRLEQNVPIGERSSVIGRLFWNQHDRNFYGTGFSSLSHGLDRGVELQAHLPFGMVLGGQWENERYTDPFNPFYSTDIGSGYAEQTQKWTDRLTSIVGLRGDHDRHFGGTVNPRATLIYQATPWLKLSGNGGRAFRAPTFADLFPSPGVFNSALNPEVTWSGDVGVEIRPTPGAIGRLTLFDAETNDRILINPNTFVSENLQRAFNRGAELEWTQRLAGDLSHAAGYAFTEARGKLSGGDYFDLPLAPRRRGRYTLEYAPVQGVQARSDWQTIGVQYFPTFTGSDRTVIRETFLWNLRLAYRRRAHEFFFSIDNLLNRRYALNANAPGSFLGQYYPQPGRTFSGGVTLHFWGAN